MMQPEYGGDFPEWHPYRRAQQRAQAGAPRESPDGSPGGLPPQNQAALDATRPSYTTQPYSRPGGPPTGDVGIDAPAAQGGVGSGPGISQPYGNAGSQIAAAYQQYLGRLPGSDEIGSHLDNGRAMGVANILHALRNIQNSPEALAYQKRQASPSATPPATPPAGGNYRSQLQSVLASTPYGFKGLESAIPLLGAGWDFQRDSSGMLRGRVKDPAGYMYDIGDASEGSQGANWVSGGTQGTYHIIDRGMQPTGVWSAFGGAAPAPVSAAPILPPISTTAGGGNSYTTEVLRYLAQQLGLGNALGGQ